MSTTHGFERQSFQTATPVTSETARAKRRAAWRQRLVDAERGISLGLRTDSTLFAHFFIGCIILAAGFVLRISLIQWSVIVLALTMVVSAELFHLVLRLTWQSFGHHFDAHTARLLRMGTAAVVVAITGALVTISLIFLHQLMPIFSE